MADSPYGYPDTSSVESSNQIQPHSDSAGAQEEYSKALNKEVSDHAANEEYSKALQSTVKKGR